METINRQDKEAVVGNVRGKYAAIALEGGSCCLCQGGSVDRPGKGILQNDHDALEGMAHESIE